MASQSPPGRSADHIAPSSSASMTRPYNTNLSTAQYTSFYSHMTRPLLHKSSMNPNTSNTGYRRESKPTAEDNTQPRFELFLLGEGEKKVTEEADTRESRFSSNIKAVNIRCLSMKFSTTKNGPRY